jgi:glycosyltransferase involved in cell wall biosynthesis
MNPEADQNRFEFVSVVIPAKNEEKTIGEIVAKAKKYAAEVIVIDGCSTDATAAEARAAGAVVVEDRGRGKGAAVRAAIPLISNKITVFIDADGSHDPADIPRLVAPILKDDADHVSGSRLLGGSSELHGGFDEFMRLMGSSFITACIGRKFRVRISDSQNGFRAIRTDVLRSLGLRERITTIEQEMVIKTLKKGYRLAEVPSHEHKRRFGTSHIRISRVWVRYVYSMVKYLYF